MLMQTSTELTLQSDFIKKAEGRKNKKIFLLLNLTPNLSSAIRKISFHSVACNVKALDLVVA